MIPSTLVALMNNNKTNLYVPQMVLIGAFGRNSGKTTLACKLIRAWKAITPVYAVKIIGIDESGGKCHRGVDGCGICSSLNGSFDIIEESGIFPTKDTSQMLKAGASKAFLVKSLKENMLEAFTELLTLIPDSAIIIAESNTLRKFVVPGVLLFAGYVPAQADLMKKSAQDVYKQADLYVDPASESVVNALRISKSSDGLYTVCLSHKMQ